MMTDAEGIALARAAEQIGAFTWSGRHELDSWDVRPSTLRARRVMGTAASSTPRPCLAVGCAVEVRGWAYCRACRLRLARGAPLDGPELTAAEVRAARRKGSFPPGGRRRSPA